MIKKIKEAICWAGRFLLADFAWDVYLMNVRSGKDYSDVAKYFLEKCTYVADVMDEHEEMAR